MKALILAAGRGSRMKHMTNEKPKCLVEYRGIPLLEHQLNALQTAGITEIGIITGYKNELLKPYIELHNLTEFHNTRWNETNMVTSLETASKWLSTTSCIVSYSDLYYESEAIEALLKSAEQLAITYDINWLTQWTKRFGDPLLDAETFKLNPDSTLKEIGNKPKSLDEIEGQYMGLLRFTPKAFEIIQTLRATLPDAVKDKMHMTGTLQKVIESKQLPIYAIPYDKNWGEFDAPEDLL